MTRAAGGEINQCTTKIRGMATGRNVLNKTASRLHEIMIHPRVTQTLPPVKKSVEVSGDVVRP